MTDTARQVGQWQQIDEQARLYRAQYQADFGEPYSLLVKIDDQAALVYSPGPGLVESARELLPDEVRLIIVAPSMGHTLGLRPWSEAFPDSRVAATSGARARILDKTQLPVVFDTREIDDDLPDWITLIDLADNPFGECWLRIAENHRQEPGDDDGGQISGPEENKGTVYWAVCDSLMNLDSLGSNPLLKMLLKWYGLGEGLHVHKRFRRGIKDKPAFRQWALEKFSAAQRQVLIPCHGDITADEQLGDALAALISRNF